MTSHADGMVDRLPTLYRDGELVRQAGRGARYNWDVDEEARIIQRGHWFDTTCGSRSGALGALLDIARAWQSLGEYGPGSTRCEPRGCGTARRPARVTRVRSAVRRGVRVDEPGHRAAAVRRLVGRAVRAGHAFIETAPADRRPAGGTGAVEPLTQQAVLNAGLDPAPLICWSPATRWASTCRWWST
jgi:hypothetical protein